jgi:hypothetical protein
MKLVAGEAVLNRKTRARDAEWCRNMGVVALRWRAYWYLGVQIVYRLMCVSKGMVIMSSEQRLTWQTLGIFKPQHQGEQREMI